MTISLLLRCVLAFAKSWTGQRISRFEHLYIRLNLGSAAYTGYHTRSIIKDRLEFVMWLVTQAHLCKAGRTLPGLERLLLLLYVIHGYVLVLGKGASLAKYALTVWKAVHAKKA